MNDKLTRPVSLNRSHPKAHTGMQFRGKVTGPNSIWESDSKLQGSCTSRRPVTRNYMLLTHPHHKCIFVAFSLCSDLSLYLISCIHILIQSICPQDKFIHYLSRKKKSSTLKCVLINQITTNTFS